MQEKQQLRSKEKFPENCEISEMKPPRGFCEWIIYYQRNKPQTNALVGGIMTILYGGQHLGWGIFNNHLIKQPWAGGYEDAGTVFWAITSWFIACIVGFFISAVVVKKISKILIYSTSSILSAISAVLFVFYPESIYAVFPSRIIAGLSFGIVYPTVLIHASEVAVPRLRGMVVSSIHLCYIIGVFTTSSSLLPVYSTRSYEVDPTRTTGINGLTCIAFGFLFSFFFNRESPVFLLRNFRDLDALFVMLRLRSETKETYEVRRDFEEFKTMVNEDAKSNLNIFDRKNFRSLLLVVLLKMIFVASFNMPLNLFWLKAVESKYYNGVVDPSGMCLSGVRWIVIIVMMFIIDFKRLKVYQISAGVSGVVLIAVKILSQSEDFDLNKPTLHVVLAFVFQISSGISIGMISDIYSTDAFDTKKKPLSIVFASTIEFLLQIFLIVSVYYLKISITTLIGVFGFVMLVGAVLITNIPDTSGLSLRNARRKFYKCEEKDLVDFQSSVKF